MVRVETLTSRPSANRAELLTQARQDPALLVPDDADIRRFRISLVAPLGTKRGVGKGGLITSTQDLPSTFYGSVVQELKASSPPAPQLPDEEPAEVFPDASDDAPSNSYDARTGA